MGYGLPETYGLSPLSQLRTGQKVWGIGSYGLSEGMGYGEFDYISFCPQLHRLRHMHQGLLGDLHVHQENLTEDSGGVLDGHRKRSGVD